MTATLRGGLTFQLVHGAHLLLTEASHACDRSPTQYDFDPGVLVKERIVDCQAEALPRGSPGVCAHVSLMWGMPDQDCACAALNWRGTNSGSPMV